MRAPERKGTTRPLYARLREHILESIRSGIWEEGDLIPTEMALAQQFGVARMTVRQALGGLIREGQLVRVRGRGTFVVRPRVERELTRMHGFSDDMRARGMVPSSVLLARDVVPAPKAVSESLSLGQREAVIRLQRLRLADAVPMALETSYLSYALCEPVLRAGLESGSLYAFLQGSLRLRIRHASQELQAALPTRTEAELLQISRRRPVLAIDQTTYVQGDGDDVPAIVGRTVYRADRYRFRLQVPY